MRKILLAGIAALAFSAVTPAPRVANAITCENCADIGNQLISYAKQAQSYATQLNQLQAELNQYANMVRNSVSIPMQAWSMVQSNIMQVRNLTNVASLMTGNSGSIIGRLNALDGYASQLSGSANSIAGTPQQFAMWQQTLGRSADSLGRTLGVQENQLQDQAAIQVAIQQHSQSAAGQMQAIQAGVEMAANNGAILQQINHTLISTAQMTATNEIVEADRRASEDAAMLHFSQFDRIATTGSKGF